MFCTFEGYSLKRGCTEVVRLHHPLWLITSGPNTDPTVTHQSVLRSGPDLSPKVRSVRSRLAFYFQCGKRADGVDGQWGDSSSHRIGTIVKPPDGGRSKAARFLISLLIPPDLIHPGPACCNPSVRYPPMFKMLMPLTKWMNHRGTRACNHFKKDRCINTSENPCLLVDNRLSTSRSCQQVCLCVLEIWSQMTRHTSQVFKGTVNVWGCMDYMLLL